MSKDNLTIRGRKISTEEINEVLSKIIQDIKDTKDIQKVTYTDIGNYIIDGSKFYFSPEIASEILEICHRKIYEEIEDDIKYTLYERS